MSVAKLWARLAKLPAGLLVASLGKALNGISPHLCGRQVEVSSSLLIAVTQFDKSFASRPTLPGMD